MPTRGGFQAAATKQKSQRLGGAFDSALAAVVLRENQGIRSSAGVVMLDPSAQLTGEVTLEWNPPNTAFAGTDPKTGLAQIEIAATQGQRFADPQPGAVKDDDQQPKAPAGPLSAGHARRVLDDPANLAWRKDVGEES